MPKFTLQAEHWRRWAIGSVEKGITVVSDGEEFYVGDILVRAFAVSHDAAEPLGYSFVCGGRQMTIVTDTGCISEEIFA